MRNAASLATAGFYRLWHSVCEEGVDLSGLPPPLSSTNTTTMKTSTTIASFVALGAAGLLTSCVVDPYYPGGSSTTTVTEYRPGYVVDTLPGGYRSEVVGGVSYYRHNDVYYRRQGSRYVVVERPGGVTTYERRDGYDRGRYDHDRYDRDHGPDYSRTTVIRTLPSGARVVTHRGTRYYESRGTYYRPASGGYIIVGSPF